MGRSRESFNKKAVRKRKEKKKKDKMEKKQARKEDQKSSSMDDMIAYVDANGMITSTPPDPGSKEEIDAEDIPVSTPKYDPSDDLDPHRKGKVTFFNDSKGFGFIIDSETQEKVFVHVNEMLDEIHEGNHVSFEVEMGQKGPVATRVKLLTDKDSKT
jgi:cold shock CspA family protein